MHKDESGLRIGTKFNRGNAVQFKFNGAIIQAYEGESVATALIAADVRATRFSPEGHARGPVCLIGSCQECAVFIDGRKVLACKTKVIQDLDVVSDRSSV